MENMKKVFLAIRKRREELNLYQEDVVDSLRKLGVNISTSALSRFESLERQKMDINLLINISKVLKKDFIKMLGYENPEAEIKYDVKNLNVYSVQSENEGIIQKNFYSQEFVVSLEDKMPDSAVVIQINGDNMEPILFDKDFLLFDTSKKFEWQQLVNKIVILEYNKNMYIKIIRSRDFKPELYSINPNYPPIRTKESDNINFIGVLVKLLSRNMSKIKF